MIELSPETEGVVIALTMSGRLSDADYSVIQPELDRRLEKGAPVRFLVDWRSLKGWDDKGEEEQLLFWIREYSAVERVAVVCPERFLEDFIRIKKILGHSDVRHFAPGQAGAALAWLKEP